VPARPSRQIAARKRFPLYSPTGWQIVDLTSPLGLAHVYATFQAQLRTCARGPGHEAGDLQRLIDLYRAWHAKFFPDLPFELFVEKLESLGGALPSLLLS
jgi:hypothetical protein